ncbi:MAG: DNA methyltransferase [Candidatus Bathyarchaeia archaeon]|nr:DNA methyltransferase [Candidatus Bathyarchaeia archaeon]
MSEKCISMKEITYKDYKEFIKAHNEITIENTKIKIGQPKKIKEYQPKDFELEKINVWSFPERGTWATHQGNFRGNWPPQMARNIILRYSKPGELVLDQMCGSGTTLIECKLLGRNAIGADINLNCIMLALDRLDFEYNPLDPDFPKVEIKTYVGDARNLNLIEDESIHLIATHPPYASIIPYNKKDKILGDLSAIRSIDEYIQGMREIAKESYRVLKSGRFCTILVGDTRRHRHHVPIAFRVMQAFLDAGFILREDIVKYQWKTKTTREKWGGLTKVADECWVCIDKKAKGYYMDFYLLFYEHLFIFRKPEKDEDIRRHKDSMKWWSERPLGEQVQRTQPTQPDQTTATNFQAFETKLNPYSST